jgi:hypothetical protein
VLPPVVSVRTEVLTVLVMKIQVMWHMTTCRLVYVSDMLTASIFRVVQEPFVEYPENGCITGNYI